LVHSCFPFRKQNEPASIISKRAAPFGAAFVLSQFPGHTTKSRTHIKLRTKKNDI
jgi:hypothetical protein